MRELHNNPIPSWAVQTCFRTDSELSFPVADCESPSAQCCMLTNLEFHGEPGYWINGIAHQKTRERLETLLDRLRILPAEPAKLEYPFNRSCLAPAIQSAIDDYGIMAITASSPTLEALITMVQADNDRRQVSMDKAGCARVRNLDFSHPSFTNPGFELILLDPFAHPDLEITRYDPTVDRFKCYVVANDGHLRESRDSNSPCLPVFPRDNDEDDCLQVNIFLVVLGANLRFRRYIKQVSDDGMSWTTRLPADVVTKMRRTMQLADLIFYKDPVPAEDSEGARRHSTRTKWKVDDEF